MYDVKKMSFENENQLLYILCVIKLNFDTNGTTYKLYSITVMYILYW